MNKKAGLLAAVAISFAMHAFGEEVVENVFSSDGTRALTDLEGWSSGKIPSVEEGVVISGVGVAILSPEMQGYSSYTVKSGATLLVGPERTLSDVTLEAGSKLVVATSVVYKCSGYINNKKDSPTTLGWMPPNCDLTKITNITGLIGGTTWTADLQGAPYSNVYLFDLTKFDPTESGDYSQTLICQFQNYIKDYDGNHTKGVVVELKKDSSGKITAYVTAARYFNNTNGLGADLRGQGSSGGTIAVSDSGGYGVKDVSFSVPISENGKTVSGGSLSAKGEGSVEIEVAENCIFDLSKAEISMKAGLVKTGAGTIVFGETLPEQLSVESGILAVQLGVPYDMSNVTLDKSVEIMGYSEEKLLYVRSVPVDGGKIKYLKSEGVFNYAGTEEIPEDGFGALNVCGENTTFELDSSIPVDTLTEVVVDSGATLIILSSVDIKKLVLKGNASLIVGENGNLKLRSFEVTAQDELKASMWVMSGGLMTVFGDGELPYIELNGSAVLEIASAVDLKKWTFVEIPSEDGKLIALPSLTISDGASLLVPGGAKFGSVNLRISGILSANGDLSLGYSASGETCSFDLTVDGGVVQANSGVLKFLCPDGTITVPDNTITFKSAVFESGVRGVYLKPQFCDTLPIEQSILFDCDNTLIDFPTGNYVLRGSTRFEFKNGGGITKSYTHVDNAAALWIAERVSISMDDGASFYWGESWIGGSRGGSALGFQPDAEGFVSLVIRGGVLEWHRTGNNENRGDFGRKVGGNGNAKIKVDGTIFKPAYGTYSRQAIFEKFYEVELGEDGLEIVNATNGKEYDIGAPLSGIGGVTVLDERKDKTDLFKLKLKKKNTARGPFSVGENVRVILDKESNWMGTFPWSDQVEIQGFQSEQPFNVTFGGLNLSKPLVYRIWKDGNDKINFVGEGIIPNGNEVEIQLKGGYNPPAGMSFDLGAVSDDFKIDSVINKNDKWNFEVVENDDGKHLRVSVQEIDEAKLVFNGGSEGSVSDLNDTNGWAGGVVPSGQDVSIDGVALEISYDVPEFSSVTLKNGAKITVAKDISLPSLNLMSGTELIVKSGYVLTLPAAPYVSFEDSDSFSLPVIKIEKGGCLSVSGNAKFGGVAMDIEGTLHSTREGDLILGYSSANTTLPFNLAVNGGTIKAKSGVMKFLCPDGAITVPGNMITFTNATLVADDGVDLQPHFCDTLPVDQSISFSFDNTFVDFATGHYELCGSSVFCFSNGGGIKKSNTSPYNATSLTLKDRVAIKMSGGASFIYGEASLNNSHGGSAVFFNPSAEGFVSLDMEDGVLGLHRSQGNGNAKFSLNGVTFTTMHASWSRGGFFDKIGEVEVGEKGLVLLNDSNATIMNISAKLTGVGDVIVDNTKNNLFSVGGLSEYNHTSTGEISVVPDKKAAFVSYNGFSWAGTVVANGWMEIIDKIEGSAYTHNVPVSVSFGALDLQADFPVKVWKDDDGNITGNDTLNVGEYVNNGGRLVPELAGEGEFVLGDKIVVGEIGDSSPLPRVAKGWTASRKTIDGKGMLVLSKGVGFMMIVR